MRVEVDRPYIVEPSEAEEIPDPTDEDAVWGAGGYDAADPSDWPEIVFETARDHWAGGPEAFDAWIESL